MASSAARPEFADRLVATGNADEYRTVERNEEGHAAGNCASRHLLATALFGLVLHYSVRHRSRAPRRMGTGPSARQQALRRAAGITGGKANVVSRNSNMMSGKTKRREREHQCSEPNDVADINPAAKVNVCIGGIDTAGERLAAPCRRNRAWHGYPQSLPPRLPRREWARRNTAGATPIPVGPKDFWHVYP